MSLIEPFQKSLRKLAEFVLNIYKVIFRIYFGNSCKYHPSCSTYSKQAFQTYGPFKAVGLTLWRLLRCNPFSHGGYDPVPDFVEVKRGR